VASLVLLGKVVASMDQDEMLSPEEMFPLDGKRPDGSGDAPFPEDHEDSEDAGDAEEGEDPMDKMSEFEDHGGSDLTEKHMRDLHKKLDKNGDGKVHIDEVLHYAHSIRKAVVKKEIESAFNEIESTQDGHLSLQEHLAEQEEFHEGDEAEKERQKQHEIAKFKAADLNGDDKLDAEELTHLMHPETKPEVLELHCQEEMRKRDANKDGKLSPEEWKVDASHGEHQDPDTHDPEADFKNLDENKDGFISMDELRHWESGKFHTHSAMTKLFELVDKDSDSHMTADEMINAIDHLDGHEAHPHLLDWVFHESDEL